MDKVTPFLLKIMVDQISIDTFFHDPLEKCMKGIWGQNCKELMSLWHGSHEDAGPSYMWVRKRPGASISDTAATIYLQLPGCLVRSVLASPRC